MSNYVKEAIVSPEQAFRIMMELEDQYRTLRLEPKHALFETRRLGIPVLEAEE
jgi:hypothetical protein